MHTHSSLHLPLIARGFFKIFSPFDRSRIDSGHRAAILPMAVEVPDASSPCFAKSVKILADRGVGKLPNKFVLPVSERPYVRPLMQNSAVTLPVIDMAALQGPQLVQEIGRACREWGFFQVVNHGIPKRLIRDMLRVTAEFFEQPEQERREFMSDDISRPVRCGTSLNQTKDRVFAWRDFLKVYCSPLREMMLLWPSSPPDYRRVTCEYTIATKALGVRIMEAVMESLGGGREAEQVLNELKAGSHMTVHNYYPACPEPELTFGIPPHTDVGCVTILAQDSVGGLQIMRQRRVTPAFNNNNNINNNNEEEEGEEEEWAAVEPVDGALVINVGDLVEILSNGRYRSIMHRVVTSSTCRRLSVATLLSLGMHSLVAPLGQLVDGRQPQAYQSTTLAEYLAFLSASDYKPRAFIDSLRLNLT